MAVEQQPAQLPDLLHASKEAAAACVPGLDAKLLRQMQGLDFAFVVSDAQQADMPIMFASDRFYEVTGYSVDEVGRAEVLGA